MGIINKDKWALKLFDSAVKYPHGILYGSLYQLGNFDECISVIEPEKEFRGQYCLADVTIKSNNHTKLTELKRGKFNNTIKWAICIPSTCINPDNEIILQSLLSNFIPSRIIEVKISDNKCTLIDQHIPFSSKEIIYISIIMQFLAIVLISTVYHSYVIYQNLNTREYILEKEHKSNKWNLREVILAFSLFTSVYNVLKVKSNEFRFISGIKFLSMTFIIIGHTLIFTFGGPIMNANFLYESVQKAQNGFFLNSTLLVDTFLMLGGFLTCNLLLQAYDKRENSINLFYIYISRYVRLTPSYMIVIGLYSTIFLRLGDGPLWNSRIGIEQERCVNSWWINLLYVNNYFNTDQLCMFQSWYLAVDTQLFIVASILTCILWKFRRFGCALLILVVIIAAIIPFAITLIDEYDPTLMIYPSEIADLSNNFYFVNYYMKTHVRAISYFIGTIFGYFIHRLQSKNKTINQIVLHFLTASALIIGSICVFSVTTFYNKNHKYNAFESAIYTSLHKIGWCLSVGFVMVACVHNPKGFVNKVLSFKLYVPLSRITYCAYLVNGFVELSSVGSERNSFYLSTSSLGEKVIVHIVLTYAGALILCVLFESPIHNLEKILLKRKS